MGYTGTFNTGKFSLAFLVRRQKGHWQNVNAKKFTGFFYPILYNRASQIFWIFGHTVFCVLLNERKLMRPSLGRLEVIFDGCQASKADQSRLTFFKNRPLDWSAFEAWQPSKMTSNLPKLGLISFLSLSRTQKTVCPKISKIWDALRHHVC